MEMDFLFPTPKLHSYYTCCTWSKLSVSLLKKRAARDAEYMSNNWPCPPPSEIIKKRNEIEIASTVGIVMIRKKIKGSQNLRAWHSKPIDRVGQTRPTRLDRSRGQRDVLRHLEIPGASLNLQDPLFRLTGCHSWQTSGTSVHTTDGKCSGMEYKT